MEPNGEFTESTMTTASFLFSQISAPSGAANTSPPQTNALPLQQSTWQMYVNLGTPGRVPASPNQPAMWYPMPAIAQHRDWLDKDERQAYMEATVEQDIAWQIASNRRARNLNQKDLAVAVKTRQSAIARLEDPTYGRHSIAMLVKVAHAFDCALRVSLISYSKLAEDVVDTSDEALYVAPFEQERHLIETQRT